MPFDDVVLNLAHGLTVCLATALAPRPNPPADVCLVPGEAFQLMLSAGLSQDRCCSGFAGVRVAGIVPLTPPAGTLSKCGVSTWRLDLEMGVARCFPFGDANAGPSCAQLTDLAEQVQSDMAAMLEAVCCLRPSVRSGLSGPSEWRPFGPDGGCTGGIMTVAVDVDACGCVV